ncbi:hypothetical protein FRB91_001663 [Serendipita sp. 411]|nr:hypothetical protein FRB91_001663 [Serendipita sp. 411]
MDPADIRPTFQSNDEPTQEMLRYLQSEMKSRLVELENLEGKNTSLEDQVSRYSKAINEDEIALNLARQTVEHYSVNIDFIRSRHKPASFQDLGAGFGTHQSASKENASYMSDQVSESMQEFAKLLSREGNRLQNAKTCMRQINDRLSLQRLQHSLEINKKVQLQNSIKVMKDNVYDIACLMRPQIRIPNEVWANVFAYHVYDGFIEYLVTSGSSFFMPTTFTLSQVCRRWRYITHDRPSLWNRVGFRTKKLWGKNQLEMFRFVLEKIRDREITFITTTPSSPITWNTPGVVDITSISGIKKSSYSFVFRLESNSIDFQARCSRLGFGSPDTVAIYPSNYSEDDDTVFSGTLPKSPVVSCHHMIPPKSIQGNVKDLHLFFSSTPRRDIDVALDFTQNLSTLVVLGHRLNVGEAVKLPKLKTLRIAVSHEHMMKCLETPSLTTLLLDPPDICAGVPEDNWSITPLLRLTSTCSILNFCDWPQSLDNNQKFYDSASSVCLELVKGSPRLTKLEFLGSWIDGEQLANSLGSSLRHSQRSAKAIEELKLYRCTGITRMDCDKLIGIVGHLRVYV